MVETAVAAAPTGDEHVLRRLEALREPGMLRLLAVRLNSTTTCRAFEVAAAAEGAPVMAPYRASAQALVSVIEAVARAQLPGINQVICKKSVSLSIHVNQG